MGINNSIQQPPYLIPGLPTAMGNSTVVVTDSAGNLAASGPLAVSYGGSGTTTAFTPGSVLFAGTSGVYSQNNSKFFWDNANGRLGIGTATPANALTVTTDALIAGLTVGLGAGAIATNLVLGNGALLQNTTGYVNVAIGTNALGNNSTGFSNTAIGSNSMLFSQTGIYNIGIGQNSGIFTTGSYNTIVGATAAQGTVGSSTVSYLVAIGYAAMQACTTPNYSVGIGATALFNASGVLNTAIGNNAGQQVTSGTRNVIIGTYTGAGAPISQTGSNYIVLSDGGANVRFISDGSGNCTVTSIAKLGYSSAAGTAVGGTGAQTTAKTDTVTINKPCGQITMNAQTLNADTTVSFTLTNSVISATDVIVWNHQSGGTIGSYTITSSQAAGSATVYVRNITAGNLSEAIVLSFAVLAAVAA